MLTHIRTNEDNVSTIAGTTYGYDVLQEWFWHRDMFHLRWPVPSTVVSSIHLLHQAARRVASSAKSSRHLMLSFCCSQQKPLVFNIPHILRCTSHKSKNKKSSMNRSRCSGSEIFWFILALSQGPQEKKWPKSTSLNPN